MHLTIVSSDIGKENNDLIVQGIKMKLFHNNILRKAVDIVHNYHNLVWTKRTMHLING